RLLVRAADVGPRRIAEWLPVAARRLAVDLFLVNSMKDSELIEQVQSQPVANISAPKLEILGWSTTNLDQSSVNFGKMSYLKGLFIAYFYVYGEEDRNHDCLRLLQHFQFDAIPRLSILLTYFPTINGDIYLMEDMTVLPDIVFLNLIFSSSGHCIGPSLFHVLRMTTGVRRLKLELHNHYKRETLYSGCSKCVTYASPIGNTLGQHNKDLDDDTIWLCVIDIRILRTCVNLYSVFTELSHRTEFCGSDCVCDLPPNWTSEELVLNSLREVQITNLRGTENEFAVVERLFSWAAVLKQMTINFHNSITVSTARELCEMLLSFSRPEISVKFYINQGSRKVLYVPED
uniref:FBD domain-containing protein n=1 Tax=Oryza glaberrima TaxID=4538 RepID=I1Q7Z2_ORYGL